MYTARSFANKFHVELINAKKTIPNRYGQDDKRIEKKKEFPSLGYDLVVSSTEWLLEGFSDNYDDWHDLNSNNSINLFAKLLAVYNANEEPNIYSLKNIFPRVFKSAKDRIKYNELDKRFSGRSNKMKLRKNAFYLAQKENF